MSSVEEIVATFSSELRKRGRKVGIEESLDATRALKLIGSSNSNLFSAAMKATLIKDFDFTVGKDDQRGTRPKGIVQFAGEDREGNKSSILYPNSNDDANIKNDKRLESSMYSPLGLKTKQRTLKIPKTEERLWFRGINRSKNSILTVEGHKFKRSNAGLVNLRRTLQNELKKAGDSPYVFRSMKRISKANVVLLCDVSGSMSDSNSKIVNICCSVKRAIPKSEIFLFSTKLKRITYYALKYDASSLSSRIPSIDLGFGGGTKIGECLRQFRETYGYLLMRKTTVVIFSDGWDIGGVSRLKHEMRELQRRTSRIVWINPFLDSNGFSVETIGMKAALEYVDSFISPSDLLHGDILKRVEMPSR